MNMAWPSPPGADFVDGGIWHLGAGIVMAAHDDWLYVLYLGAWRWRRLPGLPVEHVAIERVIPIPHGFVMIQVTGGGFWSLHVSENVWTRLPDLPETAP